MSRFLVLFFLLAGCEGDQYDGPDEGGECKPVAAVRCLHDRYQVCSSEKRWETLYDCPEYGLLCDLNEVCKGRDGGVDAG